MKYNYNSINAVFRQELDRFLPTGKLYHTVHSFAVHAILLHHVHSPPLPALLQFDF